MPDAYFDFILHLWFVTGSSSSSRRTDRVAPVLGKQYLDRLEKFVLSSRYMF